MTKIGGYCTCHRNPAPALAEIDRPRIASMRLAQRGAQAIGMFRNEDEVNVIVHQAPGQTAHLRPCTALAQQFKEPPVVIAKEHRQPAVAALGDVVGYLELLRNSGDTILIRIRGHNT